MSKKTGCFCACIVFVLVALALSCQPGNNFTVDVSFERPDPTPVRLYQLTEDQAQLVDSVFLKEGSTARLKARIDFSSIYLLKFFNDQSIYLIIHPGDKIKVEVNNIMDEISYYVKGSPDSRLVKRITDKQNVVLKTIDQLSRTWENNRSDSALLKQIDSSYAALLKEHQKYTRDFIYEHPSSLAAILALYQNFGRKSQPLFDKYDDLEVFDFVDSSLSVLYPHTEAVRALNREVTETKEQIEHSKYIEKRIVEGRPLPDLKEVSVTGDTILVDGEQHRNFLLYFWASWSAYSVDELTMLNEYAIQARPDAVTIITISIDSSQEMLKKCMDENNIRLPVICDYEYWESDLAGRYAIKKIPASILTNKAGIVIAKDIFSDELISKFKSPER